MLTWPAKEIPFWHFLEGKGDVKIVEFTGVGYDPIVPVKEQRL
jgi:hypothetical protein